MICSLRHLAFFMLAPLVMAEEVPGYTECTITHYADNRTSQKPGMLDPDARAIFGNWNTPTPYDPVPSNIGVGQWIEVDMTRKLPEGARCVALAGELIITRGYEVNQSCTLYLSFRKNAAAGKASNTVYTTSPGKGGVRVPYSVVVPLHEELGRLSFQFGATIENQYPPYGKGYYGFDWPNYCSFGASAWIEGFGR